MAVHWDRARESARGSVPPSWKVLVQEAENSTTPVSAAANMVGCSMLMRMPVRLAPCLLSRFFPVILYLVLRPFLCYSLEG